MVEVGSLKIGGLGLGLLVLGFFMFLISLVLTGNAQLAIDIFWRGLWLFFWLFIVLVVAITLLSIIAIRMMR